ncbi:ATPase synthesis protein 25 [Glarea lozoyensis ATCC 20868]|uniref:ATPase synthesis protein 25 n=1 Tax=Glarea lozoyensis (strain ATCC 20868 / MF5171) TaxID=1116229 RepID=S3CPP3_GLAL2|nr:ATPase synthesis protein 25 [Glarea lozoyensis ATCC 20868]EPE28452.1 ATPase synthesis protein 25 [Glarea lozoyensis ATCC 20868]
MLLGGRGPKKDRAPVARLEKSERIRLYPVPKHFPDIGCSKATTKEWTLFTTMVASRIFRASSCANCRLSVLRHFVSIGVQTPRIPLPTTTALRPSPSFSRYGRSFSSHRNLRQRETPGWDQGIEHRFDENDEHESVEERIREDNPGETDVAEVDLEELDEDATPWYLQVEPPERAPRPLSERQKMPELPERPPPILEPLLNQVSIDLGLDNLTLLDLRKLDPPPALGANLIMVIGTARSERHLHVSADRLCRWLRSTYKLRPSADGLLGRNELKLKLRRKAKRAKLTGGSDENADDGIRTGWVCVDVGVIEPADGVEVVEQPQGFVGFGRRTDGVRLVVQMLTEEKREEIDLERLWGGILRRSGEPGEMLEDGAQGEAVSEADLGTPTVAHFLPTRSLDGPSSVPGKRNFHTSARRLVSSEGNPPKSNTVGAETALYSKVSAFLASGDYEAAEASLRRASELYPRLSYGGWSNVFQEQLLLHIQSLPQKQALQLLGTGFTDYKSTPFLRSFYGSLEMYPKATEVEARVWLHVFAQTLNHNGYPWHGLLDLFRSLQLAGASISPVAFKRMALGVLCAYQANNQTGDRSLAALNGVLEIIRCMYSQGLEVIDEGLFVELQEATRSAELPGHPVESLESFALPSYPLSALQGRLHAFMITVDLPCFTEANRLRLMDLYRSQGNWIEFWDIFRMAHRRGRYQSASIYAFMFASVAGTGHQRGCMKALRIWISSMTHESPPVPIEGQVAQAIRACLKVADPSVEEKAKSDSESNDEWVVLWQKCGWSEEQGQRFMYE